MKQTRYTEEHIIGILKSVEAGQKVLDACRTHGISEATYHRWKTKYGGLEVSEACRLKQWEDENRRLKHLVVDLTLDNTALKEALEKMVAPAVQREMVGYLQQHHQLSQRGRANW